MRRIIVIEDSQEFKEALPKALDFDFLILPDGFLFLNETDLQTLGEELAKASPQVAGVYLSPFRTYVTLREMFFENGLAFAAVLVRGSAISEVSYAFKDFPNALRDVGRMFPVLLGDIALAGALTTRTARFVVLQPSSAVLNEVRGIVELCAKCQGRLGKPPKEPEAFEVPKPKELNIADFAEEKVRDLKCRTSVVKCCGQK